MERCAGSQRQKPGPLGVVRFGRCFLVRRGQVSWCARFAALRSERRLGWLFFVSAKEKRPPFSPDGIRRKAGGCYTREALPRPLTVRSGVASDRSSSNPPASSTARFPGPVIVNVTIHQAYRGPGPNCQRSRLSETIATFPLWALRPPRVALTAQPEKARRPLHLGHCFHQGALQASQLPTISSAWPETKAQPNAVDMNHFDMHYHD